MRRAGWSACKPDTNGMSPNATKVATPTHGLVNVPPKKGGPPIESLPTAIEVEKMSFYYGQTQSAVRHLGQASGEAGHGVHRPIRVRQEHVSPHAQPDERHHPGRPRHRQDHDRRQGPLRIRRRSSRPSARRRHGVSEVQPVPEVDLRQHRVWRAPEQDGGEPRGAWMPSSRKVFRAPRCGTR